MAESPLAALVSRTLLPLRDLVTAGQRLFDEAAAGPIGITSLSCTRIDPPICAKRPGHRKTRPVSLVISARDEVLLWTCGCSAPSRSSVTGRFSA
jgi:hypothetical protein